MFDKLKSTISKALTMGNLVKVLVAIVILIGVAIWSYYFFVKPKIDASYVPNKEFLDKDKVDSDDEAYLYFFYTTWCPHCKTARKPWDMLKTYVNENGG